MCLLRACSPGVEHQDGGGTDGCEQAFHIHTPIAVNSIVGPGTSIGSGVYGNSACPTCHITSTNTESVTNVNLTNESDVYTFNYATQVNCSMGGAIYGISGSWALSWATTCGKWVSGAGAGYCNYNAACTNTSTPKCRSHGWTTNTNQNNGCSLYVYAGWLVVTQPSGAWICYGINSNGLPVTNPGPYTPL